jgi:hypothetical protein
LVSNILDGVTDFAYTWDGDSWERHSAISSIDFVDSTPIAFAVTYPDNYSATITTTVEDQTAATIFAGPVSGIATAPTFRALASSDLPLAAAGTVGAVQPGAGLVVDGIGAINHANAAIAGTYAGAVTIDSEGHVVTAQAALSADDIPDLDASKITSGSFPTFSLHQIVSRLRNCLTMALRKLAKVLPLLNLLGNGGSILMIELHIYGWEKLRLCPIMVIG